MNDLERLKDQFLPLFVTTPILLNSLKDSLAVDRLYITYLLDLQFDAIGAIFTPS